MDKLFVLATAIALAGFLSGGLYQLAPNGGSAGGSKVLNRLTGSVWDCDYRECSPIKYTSAQ